MILLFKLIQKTTCASPEKQFLDIRPRFIDPIIDTQIFRHKSNCFGHVGFGANAREGGNSQTARNVTSNKSGVIAWIIPTRVTEERASLPVRTRRQVRSRAMGRVLATRGISNRRSQISILQFEICNLRCRRPSAHSSVHSVSCLSWVHVAWAKRAKSGLAPPD